MNEHNQEQKLDELISRTINTARPEFDPEEWRQRYPEEFEILRSRAAKGASTRRFTMWRAIPAKPIARLAAAVVIIAAVGLCTVERNSREQKRVRTANSAKSPAEMMTALSLRITHRHGGIEAVEEQYSEAHKLLGPRPRSLSVEKILAEFNGT